MIKKEKYLKLFKIMKDGGPGSGRKPEGKSRLPGGNDIASRMSGNGYPRPEKKETTKKNDYPEIDEKRGSLDLSRYANKGLHNYPNLLRGLTDLLEYDELLGPNNQEDWETEDYKKEHNLDRLSNKSKSMYQALKSYMKQYGIYDDGDTSPDIQFGEAPSESFNNAIETIYFNKYNRAAPPSQRANFGLRRNDKYKPKENKYKGQTGWTSAGYINPDGSVPSNGPNW